MFTKIYVVIGFIWHLCVTSKECCVEEAMVMFIVEGLDEKLLL